MKIIVVLGFFAALLTGCNVHLKGEADVGVENPYERIADGEETPSS